KRNDRCNFVCDKPRTRKRLWESLRKEPLHNNEVDCSDDVPHRRYFDAKSDPIEVLIEAHNQAQSWQTKRQILSLFASDFSKSEWQRMIPSLLKWRIDQARDHAIKSGKGQPVQDKPLFRSRINSAKVDHFLDFISRPELLQDVAFGTKTLRLDSGERIVIPAAVRTLIPSRIIEQYAAYCKQQEFESASERSLYRMLDVCSASMQKSLQGLDNITAEGTQSIDSLVKIVENLVENAADETWGKRIQHKIKEVKRYFKTDFKAHIGKEENCADHCITHSLSDPKAENYTSTCNHNHNINCERCESLELVLQDIKYELDLTEMDDEQRSRVEFDLKQCETSIYARKAHLLRTITQDEAKQETLNKLDQETCLIICDWAMKFLPLKYRENMSEFFGKRGLSWHASAVVTMNAGNYEVECFVHIFNSCTQNNCTIASIFEHLFRSIKAEYPLINIAYIRSDNAGCYHNGPLLLCLPEIGKTTGITVARYDFPEPQSGKDICDRKIAPMKAHIRRFVNENHDVVSAEDMKVALESHGGLKGCRAAVVEVDSSQDLYEGNKIPDICLPYNFQYETNVASLKVVKSFGPRQKERGAIGKASKTAQAEIFSCSESTCILTFRSEREAQAHMDTGKHVRELESVSLMGWDLKTTKKRPRFGEKVKGYLIEKFQAGETSGNKADPQTVSREMKFKNDENGKLFFQPDEWKTAQQIKSFFSRSGRGNRVGKINICDLSLAGTL
ncbi:Transposon Tf2-6 poly, partial [Paramuricea clavata]